MTASEKLLRTLNFEKMSGGGSVTETFFPWTLTVDRWLKEGLPAHMTSAALFPPAPDRSHIYCNDLMSDPVWEFENFLGFDGMKRMSFNLPVYSFEPRVLEETEDYVIRLCADGWQRKFHKKRDLTENIRPVLVTSEDWEMVKEKWTYELETYCTDEKIREIYGQYTEGQKRGDYSIRFELRGFFWIPRDLFGIEEHLMAFYEEPELMHEINSFILELYLKYLDKIFDHIKPETLYLSEDLSGANGPMISPAMFDEFVGTYYRRLIPFLKQKGIPNVLVDTDGDFRLLIPNFLDAGVEGFIPLDVNAGMDIVELRKEFPKLKFVGGFNKLCIATGPEAIDREFERLLPVIRQGGYLPGCDHQVAPSTSLGDYLYYIRRLKEVMMQAGADC